MGQIAGYQPGGVKTGGSRYSRSWQATPGLWTTTISGHEIRSGGECSRSFYLRPVEKRSRDEDDDQPEPPDEEQPPQ
jgi:hypothetical protein